jgi:Xaa-Pro dipeptidase
MNQRLHNLTKWLSDEEIAVAFVNSTENVFYLSNFYTDPHERLMGIFICEGMKPFFVLPQMEVNQLKDAGWSNDIIGYQDHEDPWKKINQKLASSKVLSNATVTFETEFLTYKRAQAFLNNFEQPTIIPLEDKLNQMRVVKEDEELEIIKRAAEMADYGVSVGIEALKEGITEMEVLATIEFELKKKGIREMSFSTMVLFGEKSGDPHGNPGTRTLQKGDMVLFDLGVVLDGYCSDITRTVAFQSVSDEQRKMYETVLQAQLASLEISKPGTRIGELDLAARNVITEADFGEYFPHRIGHGMGINVHEFPSMSHLNEDHLKIGMVYTIEPGIYIPNVGGVRIEDDVYITKDGHETLTKFPKELMIVG